MTITQEQFDAIFEHVLKIQEICDEADTSSINMWLSDVEREND